MHLMEFIRRLFFRAIIYFAEMLFNETSIIYYLEYYFVVIGCPEKKTEPCCPHILSDNSIYLEKGSKVHCYIGHLLSFWITSMNAFVPNYNME